MMGFSRRLSTMQPFDLIRSCEGKTKIQRKCKKCNKRIIGTHQNKYYCKKCRPYGK